MTTSDLLNNLKLAWVTAVGTASTGTATLMEWIPTDVGKIASLFGVILTIVLIRLHWRNGNAKYELTKLESKELQQKITAFERKEEERIEAAAKREASGEPLRRNEDSAQ